MKIKCDYCGSYIDDTEEICPHCGAVNEHVVRNADGIPKTIEELKAFCQNKSLPLIKMRFFIGVDYKQPKAFGIYKDSDGNFVVYKNKGDGTRVERYRGKDEAYAVNEIYQQLRSEIQIRKEKNSGTHVSNATRVQHVGSPKARRAQRKKRFCITGLAIAVVIMAIMIIVLPSPHTVPHNGYYKYHDDYYYCQNTSWYIYDDYDDIWIVADAVDSALYDNYYNYYEGGSYQSSYNISDFSDTSYFDASAKTDYNDNWNNDNWDNDDDWDWGDDDWDIDDTDWDTDW